MTSITLFDTFTVDDVRRTGDGYVAAFARVARTGIQEYRGYELGRPDLDVVRVYRPPEEVFHADALQSFAHRPVTLKHPPVPVTSKNWKKYSRGQTGGDVVRDGEFVRVPMVMMDQSLIDAYEKDGIKQLSLGYSTDIKWRTGVVDAGQPDAGQTYDAVQTAIRGNHLAVVPEARGGRKLAIGDRKPLAFRAENDFRSLVSKLADMVEGDDDDDEDDEDEDVDNNIDDPSLDDPSLNDAWSDEARAAALEARRANAKSTPAGARGGDGHYLVPGGQGQDPGRVEHPLHRTILNAGYKYSHSTPIHKLNGDTVMHHTYEKGEHKSNPGSSVMDTHKVSVSNDSDKWTTSTGGGSGRQTTGEGQHSLDNHLASKAKRYKELRDSSSSDDDDYTSCPECGADIPPNTPDCPACGHHMTNDGAITMAKIVIDGVPVNVMDERDAAIIDRHLSSLTRKLADASADFEKMKKEKDDSDKNLDDAKKIISAKDGEIAVLNKKVTDSVISPDKLDVMVKDRLLVIDSASTLLDKGFTFDGKTVETIRRAAVEAHLGDSAKGMDDAAIGGAFAALTNDASKSRGGSQPIRQALFTGGRQQVGDARQTAYDEKVKNLNNSWRKPGASA